MKTLAPSRYSGFTLLELSIVLVILAVVIGGGLAIFTSSLQKSQQLETEAKLAVIQKMLFNYRVAFNRLPCPADVFLPITDNNFGVEAANPGSCTGGVPAASFTYTPYLSFACDTVSGSPTVTTSYDISGVGLTGAELIEQLIDNGTFPAGSTVGGMSCAPGVCWFNMSSNATATHTGAMCTFFGIPADDGGGSSSAVEGMVPTATLNLPDDYAFDGWGRRIMYAASNDLTQTNAFAIIPANDLTNRMTIMGEAGTNKTTQAGYVAFSYGPNGYAAIPRSGGVTRLPLPVNADERKNYIFANGIFVQKEATQNPAYKTDDFDDIVTYATRSNLRTPNE